MKKIDLKKLRTLNFENGSKLLQKGKYLRARRTFGWYLTYDDEIIDVVIFKNKKWERLERLDLFKITMNELNKSVSDMLVIYEEINEAIEREQKQK